MADEQEKIDLQASTWLVWIEEDGLDAPARRKFDGWLGADPRHRAAYDKVQHTWREIPGLVGLAGLAPKAPTVDPASIAGSRPGRQGYRWPAIGLGVAAALLLTVALPRLLPLSQSRYATALAETRVISLSDGSNVTLGARSSISVKFNDGERRVILFGGEAFFDVVHDAVRPFVVEAGPSIIRDIGTKFDVNLSDASVRVAVLEGLVQVSRADIATIKPRLITAGERTEIVMAVADGATPATPAAEIVAMPAQTPGAWREGRLVFDNVRLADLAADVNRYYAPGVTLASAGIGDLRVTASFKTHEVPAFMGALGATLPVRVDQASNGSFAVSRNLRQLRTDLP